MSYLEFLHILFFKKKTKHTFIYLFLLGCAGSSLLHRLFSSCSEWELLFIAVCRLLIAWALLLWSMGSRHVGSIVEAPRL